MSIDVTTASSNGHKRLVNPVLTTREELETLVSEAVTRQLAARYSVSDQVWFQLMLKGGAAAFILYVLTLPIWN